MITSEQIKKIREKTKQSVIECKNALEKTNGDEEKALKILEKKGEERAGKRSERETKQGLIETYVHNNGKIGVILELNCETDFVAKNENFKELAHNISMHIAAMGTQDLEELLDQPFVKDQEKTIKDLITEVVSKLGENIKIGKFYRLEI